MSISRNGQLGCPFYEMDNFLVHFTKWTISHLGHNIYIFITKDLVKFVTPWILTFFFKGGGVLHL